MVVKYVKYTAFFLSDGAWDIAEPMLEDLSTKPISCLHAMGQEMWAASGGYIYKMILRPHSDGGITVEKVSLNFLCYKMCKFKSKEQQSFSSLHFSMFLQAVVEVSSKDNEEICCMATAGVGLLVSFKDHAVIRIFHLETFKHLQDANLASNINKLFGG